MFSTELPGDLPGNSDVLSDRWNWPEAAQAVQSFLTEYD